MLYLMTSMAMLLTALGLLCLIFYRRTRSSNDDRKRKVYYGSERRKSNLINQISQKDWYQRIDHYARESGYAFTPEFIIGLHGTVIVLFLYGIWNLGLEVTMKGVVPSLMMGILVLHLMIHQKTKERKNKIRLELCNIQDVMYYQDRIGTSIDIVLTHAAQIAREPLKEPLEYLATAPKVKKTVEKALEELRRVSDIAELQSFSFILEQRQYTGNSAESHRAMAQMMKRSKRLRRKIDRETKRTKLMVASLLLFGCYILLLTVPLITEAMNSLELLFR